MLAVGLSVYNDTISSLNGVNGIPSLIDYYTSNAGLVTYKLFKSGCMINGIQNCTTVCSDTRLIWSNESTSDPLSNFANCIAYPLIVDILVQGDLVSPSFSNTAKQFGIEAVDNETLTAINASTQACFAAYCTDNIRCSEGQSGYFPFVLPDVQLPSDVPRTEVLDYIKVCDNKGVISTDIAGIGIVTANLIQVSLLYFFWLVLRILAAKRVCMQPRKDQDFVTERMQRYIRESHYGRTTIQALVSFQKAQCGFSLALLLAIVKASGSKTSLGAVNQSDLKINLKALMLLAVAGTLMPVLTQYLLQELHQSWSLFFLSIVTAFASYAVQKVMLRPERWKFVPESAGLWMNAYGGTSPPNLCDLDGDLNLEATTSFHDLTFAMMVVGLVIVICCACCRKRNFFADLCPLFDLIFLGSLSWYASFLPGLLDRNISIDESGWSFGQVIAVTLWLPLMIDWIYKMIKPELDKLLQPFRAWCIHLTKPCWVKSTHISSVRREFEDGDGEGEFASKRLERRHHRQRTDIEAQQPSSKPRMRIDTTVEASVASPLPTPLSAARLDTRLLKSQTPTSPEEMQKPRRGARRARKGVRQPRRVAQRS